MFIVIEQTMMGGSYTIPDWADQGFDTFEHALTATQHWAKTMPWETAYHIMGEEGAVVQVLEPTLSLKLEGRARELARSVRDEGGE